MAPQPFQGTFDGNDCTVSGLYIHDYVGLYAGLFGYISGTVKNLTVTGLVAGINYAGGIAGMNTGGTIENCHNAANITSKGSAGGIVCYVSGGNINSSYNTGTISGNSGYAGGIAGIMDWGAVQSCYNTGAITCTDPIPDSNWSGGIVGMNIGTVSNCYNTGAVSGSGSVGGVVGSQTSSKCTGCFYLEGTAEKGVGDGNDSVDSVEQKSAADFRSLASTLGEGWENDTLLGRPVLKENREPIIATAEQPFEIPDKAALENFRNFVNAGNDCAGMYFEVTNNIDLGGSEDDQWTPIGNDSNQFDGIFDGGGHTISGLYISGSSSYQGLFGYIGESGTVKNLTVDGMVTCYGFSAGIVGINYGGTVENCHNKCAVNATSVNCGGVVGVNESGTVTNCYNTGEITGVGRIGGIVASNAGTVKDCYNTGNITGGSYVGGIVGENKGDTTNCYYLTGTAEKGIGNGEGEASEKSAAQFASGEVAYLLQKDQGTQVWGQTVGNGYPELTDSAEKTVYKVTFMANDEEYVAKYANLNDTVTLPEANPSKTGLTFAGWSTTESGTADFNASTQVSADTTVYAVWKIDFTDSGTADNPYLIPDKATLEAVRDYVNGSDDGGSGKYFKLTNNIDLDGSEDDQWTPIGNDNDHRFKGTFDGDGHTIGGLYINKRGTSCQGLFGRLWYATVKNLTVTGSITGMDTTGGIAGLCEISSIENCINECAITGGYGTVGGISGKCNGGSITGCRNTGTITAPMEGCGGIAGNLDSAMNYDAEGSVTDCFNTGAINSTTDYAGGIVGDGRGSGGTITNCYNTGTVYSVYSMDTAGAIIGLVGAIEISNSYYLDTSCDTAGGGTAKNEAEFNSGEVAWLLQAGRTPQVWGQTVGTGYPELTDNTEKKVCKVTFHTESKEEYAVKYANYNGKVELPDNPTLDGTAFDHWSTAEGASGGEKFDNNTTVTGDITVYAVGRETFGGESNEIMLTTTYGEELTKDLSEYIAYKSGTATAGKFTYTITDGNNELKATIEGDNLKIPETANARSYTLKIEARENEPQYSLMSVDTYGIDTVTLTVKVTIEKANPTVTPPVGIVGLVYNGTEQNLVTAGSTDGGEMQYSLDGSDYSPIIPTGTDAKEYTVWYKVVGGDNYDDVEAQTLTVSISKVAPTVTVQAVTGTYGEDITLTAQVTANDVDTSLITGEVTFKSGETELGKGIKGADNKWTLTLTKADSEKEKALFDAKTVTANYAGNDNIERKDGSNTATIGPRELKYTVAADGREYLPGSTEVTVHLTPIDYIEGDDVTLTATGNLSKEDVGTYESVSLTEIAIDGRDKAYYTVVGTADNVPLTSPVTISQIKAVVETPPTGKEGLTYTGNPLGLLTSGGTSTGGTMQYYVGENDSAAQPDETAAWKESISDITATDAGTYTIWYRANGNIDYTTSDLDSIEITISKATPTVSVQAVTGTYGEDITVTAQVTVGDLAVNLISGTIEFKAGGTSLGTADVVNGTATLTVSGTERDKQHALFGTDGSSTVTAAYSGNDNIEGESGNGEATIGSRELQYTVTAEDKTFDGESDISVTLTPSNALSGDQVSLTAMGAVESPAAGAYSTVDLTDIALSGEDARYYTVETEKTGVELASPVNITRENTGAIQGKVTQDGEPVANATVTLKQGGETVATTTTGADGSYYFEDADPGVYEIVVETESKTMTSMVEYTEETGTEENLELPVEDVSSVLDTEKAPDSVVAVGGLDDAASENAETGSAVTVTMTVESKTESTAEHAQEIKSVAGNRNLDYLEIGLEKTTAATGGEPTIEPLTETKQLITIVLRFDFTGKDNVVVYRYHGTAVDTLTETNNLNGEYIALDEAGGTITLHVKNFSTYAIGYTQAGETPAPPSSYPSYYSVTVPSDFEGGNVTSNRTSAQQGSKITLTVKPDEGYHFGSLTVNDRNGKPVALTDNGDGTYTFTMPYGQVTVKAEFVKCNSLSFTDLDVKAWYHDYTDYVIAHGLMQGIGGDLFEPDGTVTRAQMVTVLWNMRGNPVVNFAMDYDDVSESAWYAEAIRWATSEGVAGGYGGGKFGPNDAITREQMATMLYRFEQKYGEAAVDGQYELPFADAATVSSWAREAVSWCSMEGILTGKEDNRFDPSGSTKRSEMAATFTRYLKKTAK